MKARITTTFVDNTSVVKSMVNNAKTGALIKLGSEAVTLIRGGMDTLYGRPIWLTGALHRDVQYGNITDNSVDAGSTLHYAGFVHDGTRKMAARPYIPDSLSGDYAKKRLQEVAQGEFARVMKD